MLINGLLFKKCIYHGKDTDKIEEDNAINPNPNEYDIASGLCKVLVC